MIRAWEANGLAEAKEVVKLTAISSSRQRNGLETASRGMFLVEFGALDAPRTLQPLAAVHIDHA